MCLAVKHVKVGVFSNDTGVRRPNGMMVSCCAASPFKTTRWNWVEHWSRAPPRLARTPFVCHVCAKSHSVGRSLGLVRKHGATWRASTTVCDPLARARRCVAWTRLLVWAFNASIVRTPLLWKTKIFPLARVGTPHIVCGGLEAARCGSHR